MFSISIGWEGAGAMRASCWCKGRHANTYHDDVIKWKHFPRNWPFVREIHRSPVNFPHKGQWRGALMFSLIYAWINDWVNNREAGDLRRQHGHYDVIVMWYMFIKRHMITNLDANGFTKNTRFNLWPDILKSKSGIFIFEPNIMEENCDTFTLMWLSWI